MSDHQGSRNRALRASAVVESGLDPAFDRLANLAVMATRAPICLVLFGDEALIKGYSGPGDAALEMVRPPRDFYESLLADDAPAVQVRGELAGAAVLEPGGMRVGCVCLRTPAPRIWTPQMLGALSDFAQMAGTELAIRASRQPDNRTAVILESISDACVFLDREFRYTYVNKRAGEIFKRNPSDLLGKHIWTEFPEGVGQKFYHAYNRAMAEQVFVNIAEYYPPWNRWFENRIYPSPEGLAIFFRDITAHRQEELERNRLASIIEMSEDLVLVASADGKLLHLNPTGRCLLGLSDDADVSNVHLVGIHTPESHDRICEAMPEAMKGRPWEGEATLAGSGGRKIPVRETLMWHEATEPDGGYFSLRARDLSDRRRADEQLERAAEFREQTERLAHIGYFIWEIGSNRMTLSPELQRIFGLEAEQFQATFEGYLERLYPEDRARAREIIEQALNQRTPFTFRTRIVRPRGETRHLRSWGSVSVNDAGQVTEVFGTSLDVTDLVVATEELRHSQEFLSTALKDTGVAVWEWVVHSNQVRFSERAADALGLRQQDLTSTFDAYLQCVHPDDLESVLDALRSCVAYGKDIDREHRIRLPNGDERWIVGRGRGHVSTDGSVDRVVGTLVDVTERHRAEEEHRQLLERLAQAQKLEAIGRLSAGVAHDFNNHLTIVLNATEHILRSSAGLDSSAREALNSIREAAGACTALTSQFLAFSRNQRRSLKLAPMDLNAVVRNACKLLRRLLPDAVTLEFSPAPALEPVRADREQIDRVLLNLVVNARDAMPDGGRLTLLTRAEDDHAVLEIQDTGVGMTPEVRAHIFEPFFTTKSHTKGIGLGLATVYGIVAQSGGSIEVQTEPGNGTTFLIRLPFAKQLPTGQLASPSSTE